MDALLNNDQVISKVEHLKNTLYKMGMTTDELLRSDKLPNHFRLNVGGALGRVFFDKVGLSYTAAPELSDSWIENIHESNVRDMIRDLHMGKPEAVSEKLMTLTVF